MNVSGSSADGETKGTEWKPINNNINNTDLLFFHALHHPLQLPLLLSLTYSSSSFHARVSHTTFSSCFMSSCFFAVFVFCSYHPTTSRFIFVLFFYFSSFYFVSCSSFLSSLPSIFVFCFSTILLFSSPS